MSSDSPFQCPHCYKTVFVANELMGKVIECNHCHKQFQAQAPLATPESEAKDHDESDVVATAAKGEHVLRQIHPVAFRNHLFLTTLALVIAASGIVAFYYWMAEDNLFGIEGTVLLISAISLMVLSGLYFLIRWFQKISTTVKVTSQRTIVVRGIVAQSTNEVQHDDVRNMKSDRNLMERLLNYGDLALSSSGQDDMEIVVNDIPDPIGVIEVIRSHQ